MVLTGASSPEGITHCFVLKGAHLAWAMLEGEKVYGCDPLDEQPVGVKSKNIENRHGRLAPGWYGVGVQLTQTLQIHAIRDQSFRSMLTLCVLCGFVAFCASIVSG